jgi:hypothetical protein
MAWVDMGSPRYSAQSFSSTLVVNIKERLSLYRSSTTLNNTKFLNSLLDLDFLNYLIIAPVYNK